MALLEVNDLHTFFTTKKGIVKAVNGVSYSLEAGKTIGIVGESGSGKSVSAMSILQLLDGNGYIESGSIKLEGRELTTLTIKEMNHIRGNEISVIFQEPMTSLNPVFSVDRQLSEPFMVHQGMNKKEAHEHALQMLYDVQIPNPEVVIKQYPHQLSGGMRQRVVIAMALSSEPEILIADEPTTALDVTVQAQIIDLIKDLTKKRRMTTILITHDLGVVAGVCDSVVVLYAGRICEKGTAREIFKDPHHQYTKGLIAAVPGAVPGKRLVPIEGTPVNLKVMPKGCAFFPRCTKAMEICRDELPPDRTFSETHSACCWMNELPEGFDPFAKEEEK